jgi:hypothetical protein
MPVGQFQWGLILSEGQHGHLASGMKFLCSKAMRKWIGRFAIVFPLLLAACTPLAVTPAKLPPPAAMQTVHPESPTQSVDRLVRIIEASDPDLPTYDPNSRLSAEFSAALQQLATMGPHAIDAAATLAAAIAYPRPDAYLAAQTLIALGPEIAATTLPVLIRNLRSR